MMLVEETFVPDAALPVEALKRHLRLGSGFAEDTEQDLLLTSFLRAALAAIESRTGKALLRRSFVLTVNAWEKPDCQTLPVAPVMSVTEVSLCRPLLPDVDLSEATVVNEYGLADVLDPMRYRLEVDTHVPRLRPRTAAFPAIPTDGLAAIRFTSGVADTFDELPGDLTQAVLMLAAHYDEYRNDVALGQGCMPFGVTSLIARYRPLRIGFSL
ncbi:gene transfer agent protein [Puniceibacterium sp. IMCC21224]|uniref:head-tail connector protein n=1 Tax=Puniceibacterium sp. IMCC21224 TaxID=1618204 RepID=UPI00064DFF7D|nr:gene transfer agent protein [Puniceibacterium sp. IMCC21224]KMK67711.1 hypothetical protein IMCC21224_112583 [Puniceibacterium sp. IMCC21224]